MPNKPKFVFIISTSGSVFRRVILDDFLKSNVHSVISDRDSDVINFAKEQGISSEIIHSSTGRDFSEKITERFSGDSDLIFISFYTRIFSSDLVGKFKNRIINFHPSILPACPGKNGFEDTLASGAKFIGATAHFVDEGVDTGMPIIQSAEPYNPYLSISDNRHKVYLHQCKMLKQLMYWILDERLKIRNNRVLIEGAEYKESIFSPNIEIEC